MQVEKGEKKARWIEGSAVLGRQREKKSKEKRRSVWRWAPGQTGRHGEVDRRNRRTAPTKAALNGALEPLWRPYCSAARR